MVIYHAAFTGGRLAVWGEAPVCESSLKERMSCENGTGEAAYPYDAGAERVREFVKMCRAQGQRKRLRHCKAYLWAPSVKGFPVASSPLVFEPPKAGVSLSIEPFEIAVIHLEYGDALDILCRCANTRTLGKGVVIGEDLLFWADVMRAAGALVSKQRFLPCLIEEKATYCARWKPMLEAEERRQIDAFAEAMPHVCRAFSRSRNEIPETSAASAVEEFITKIADQIIRSACVAKADKSLMPGSCDEHKMKRGSGRIYSENSVHDVWLDALLSENPLMECDKEALKKLASDINSWQKPLRTILEAPLRLCFKVEEPKNSKSETWRVAYMLQDLDDFRLLIPLREVWCHSGKKESVLDRYSFDVREYVFTALGHASRICSHVEESLKAKNPTGYETDSFGAYRFLSETSGDLEQTGFSVIAPSWWAGKGTVKSLNVRANVRSPDMKGRSCLKVDDIVSFEWEAALGDKKMTLKELKALAGGKTPLVRMRGEWVHVNPEEIQLAAERLESRADSAPLAAVVRMSVGTSFGNSLFPIKEVSATGCVSDILDRLTGQRPFELLETPEGFAGELRSYQVKGFSWLFFLKEIGFGACLADDMGLGKSVQVLALIQKEWSRSKKPVLIICPKSAIANWQREASKFTPELPVLIYNGTDRKTGEPFEQKAGSAAIVISSYSLLSRDIEILKSLEWSGAILDEARNIKNSETAHWKCARLIKSDYRIALTGMPVENNINDLWSIMEYLNPGFLGDQTSFRRDFFIPIHAGLDKAASDRLKSIVGPFIMRRSKNDRSIIKENPQIMEMKVYCSLTKEQASLYIAVLSDLSSAIEKSRGSERKGLILATLMRLKQICNHPRELLRDNSQVSGRSGKLLRLTDMLEEVIEAGERALVFTQFAETGEMIKSHCQEIYGCEVMFLHGKMPLKKREEMINRFQALPDAPSIFVFSSKEGEASMNLTSVNHVFHFDRWRNGAIENHAVDRAYGIDQKRNLQIYKLICAGTLEDKIDIMTELKKGDSGLVADSGEGWVAKLSNEELEDMLSLDKEVFFIG